jgi:hypothetical protein
MRCPTERSAEARFTTYSSKIDFSAAIGGGQITADFDV